MLSSWHVLCIVPFLKDRDKLCIAETSQEFLRLLRVQCVLNSRLYEAWQEMTTRLLRYGWNIAGLQSSLEYCANLSEVQRLSVTDFVSDERSVNDPRLCQFPNLRVLFGEHNEEHETVRLSSFKRLAHLDVVFAQPRKRCWQKMELPESLVFLQLDGVVPRATSLSLEQLHVTCKEIYLTRDVQFHFPALQCLFLYAVSGAEHVLACLPETMDVIWLRGTKPSTFLDLVRFQRLRMLRLETELFDESFAALMLSLPETLVQVNLVNTERRFYNGLSFGSLGRMKNLCIVDITGIGGVLDMNDLRPCKDLKHVKLRDMDAVENTPNDPQTIWPQLAQANFEISLRNKTSEGYP